MSGLISYSKHPRAYPGAGKVVKGQCPTIVWGVGGLGIDKAIALINYLFQFQKES